MRTATPANAPPLSMTSSTAAMPKCSQPSPAGNGSAELAKHQAQEADAKGPDAHRAAILFQVLMGAHWVPLEAITRLPLIRQIVAFGLIVRMWAWIACDDAAPAPLTVEQRDLFACAPSSRRPSIR